MADEVLLTTVEQLLMAEILLEENDAYGSSIYDKAVEIAKPTKVSFGSLYPTLDRLERRGFLKSRISDPIPERGGRSRRYFSVTGSGQKALKHSEALSRRIMGTLQDAWGIA
jgi:PadR family transcriptional regulator, regulatory protein PadR